MLAIPIGDNPKATRTAAIHARRDELLTVKEYADLTRQHVKSVWRRIADGRQRGICKVDGQWRIDATIAIVRCYDEHGPC